MFYFCVFLGAVLIAKIVIMIASGSVRGDEVDPLTEKCGDPYSGAVPLGTLISFIVSSIYLNVFNYKYIIVCWASSITVNTLSGMLHVVWQARKGFRTFEDANSSMGWSALSLAGLLYFVAWMIGI